MEDCRLVYNFVLLCPVPRAEMAEMEILMKEKHPQDERDAFNRLYLDYQPRFVRFANSYIRDLPVAEDIVTERSEERRVGKECWSRGSAGD